MELELTSPHHVTAGFLGTPGARTFFVQAEDETQRVSFVVEKSQVAGIAELLGQVLRRLGDEPASDWDRAAMALREPVEPLWRVGSIGLGLDPDDQRVVLELGELVPDDEEGAEARLWLDRDQARRLAAHAEEVVGQGRPRCELCGRPTEPDGAHVCPATNGHGQLSR